MRNRQPDLQYYQGFLSRAMHEIRTPLQTILGTAELLSETELSQEQKDYIQQIQFSSEVLIAFANDMLDMSKLQSNNFVLENIPFNLLSVIERTMDMVSIEAHSKGIEIDMEIDYNMPLWLMGDPIRIQQILLNLAKNAVKFTHSGYVSIAARKEEREDFISLEVRDSGIGIPADKRKKIFNAYYQADASTSRKYGGTGLGLSICSRLAALMNGNITVRENPGGGSIFAVKLPCRESEPPAGTEAHQPYRGGIFFSRQSPLLKSERFLIVDNSLYSAGCMERKLRFFGCINIQTALDGEAALSQMRKAAADGAPFTIVFIDMQLIQMDGWHLASIINRDKNINSAHLYLNIPVGQVNGDTKMKMLKWFNGYLYKPAKHKELYALLMDSLIEPFELEPLSETGAADTIPAAAVQETKPVQDTPQYNHIKAIVADDHEVNLKLAAAFLAGFGISVFKAKNGNEAVSLAAQHPDTAIVFMDIYMPDKNGTDAAAELRKTGYGGLIIACTANSDAADFKLYRKAGMDDILTKPFKKQSVQNLLEKWAKAGRLPAPSSRSEPAKKSRIDTLVRLLRDMNESIDKNDKNEYDSSLLLFRKYFTEFTGRADILDENT